MQYKVCLIGPTQSGKTRFMNRLLGVNIPYYSTTIGVEVWDIEREECIIKCWDIGSKILGLGIEYTTNCDGILQFHDENDNSPPFEAPQRIPIVHVYGENERNDLLQSLIDMMH